jgi:glycosyltransferase involved in cell wall biosynthesis
MTMISVFTPSHNPRFLDECWASLRVQTVQDFEWIVVLNQGARWECDDPRVKVHIADEIRGVGAAKHAACALATGDILVELDHDDVLTTDALEEIAKAFAAYPESGFVYSDGAQILEDGSKDLATWDVANGWEYRMETVEVSDEKVEVLAVKALEPSPHNLSFIWWSPNHVRAFRRSVYEQVGGYNMTMDVLDDQDLMCRMYQATEFFHIPETLYLQRTHQGMTQKHAETNALIQTRTVELHDQYVEPMALAWAKRKGLLALDLGGAHNSPPGYASVDRVGPANFIGDVFDVLAERSDSSVGVIRASDFLEHVEDKIRIANEIHRVLAPDGMLLSLTPSTDGRGAWQDPTHVAGYNINSFWYLTDIAYAQYVPELTAKFQTSRAMTFYPSDFHREHDISYVRFDGIALKPGGVRNGGYVRW